MKNCLDHFMLKLDTDKNSAFIAILNTSITDHYMIWLKISHLVAKEKCSVTKTTLNFEKALDSLKSTNLHELLRCDDLDFISLCLINAIRKCIIDNGITSTISVKNRIIKPWITLGALRCIRNRYNLQKKLRSDPDNMSLKITYKRYRNYRNNLIKKLKRQYDREQLNRCNKNPTKLWRTINYITNKKLKIMSTQNY